MQPVGVENSSADPAASVGLGADSATQKRRRLSNRQDRAQHYELELNPGETMEGVENCHSNAISDAEDEATDGTEPRRSGSLLRHSRSKDFIRASQLVASLSELAELERDPMKQRTAAHYAALSCQGETTLLLMVQRLGCDCLMQPDLKQVTPLHFAAASYSREAFGNLLSAIKAERRSVCAALERQDIRGRTCAHFAACNKNFEETIFALLDNEAAGPSCLKWQNYSKQSVLHLLLSRCSSETVLHLVSQEMLQIETPSTDIDGSTLLHALFQNTRMTACGDVENFIKTALMLVEAGIDPCTENVLGHNCLHGAAVSDASLVSILSQAASRQEAKALFQALLTNSQGHHAVHAFAGRYMMSEVSEPLAQLSGVQVSELLRLTVLRGPSKGATCLHFACEAGHVENVTYLMKEGLLMSDHTHSGLSCLDFAYDAGKLEAIEDSLAAQNVTEMDLCRLIDPVRRSLKLPDQTTSRQLLASICDEPARLEMHRNRRSQKVVIRQDTAGIAVTESGRTDLRILLKALELDSPKVFRAALSLKLITAETERLFPAYLKQVLSSTDYEGQHSFPSYEVILGDESRMELFHDSSELAIVDLAVLFGKTEILPDLILTRQFELLPACLSVLARIKQKVAAGKEGSTEPWLELQKKVTCIALNAIDEMFAAANENERRALFSYFKGDMCDEAHPNPGPKFPSRDEATSSSMSAVKYCTIMSFVEAVNCKDLLATDCLYTMVKEEWSATALESSSAEQRSVSYGAQMCRDYLGISLTQRKKFFIQLTAFALFLLYFAWYVTNFQATFENAGPDVILTFYAVAFTCDEAVDLYVNRRLGHQRVGSATFRCPAYFSDAQNIFDASAIVLMWIGLGFKYFMGPPESPLAYPCHMILCTAFMIWGFRSMTFLNYNASIGPVISMLKYMIIHDLLPFFAIIFIIFYSFGVFFTNLLFPDKSSALEDHEKSSYWQKMVLEVFTLPFDLMFTIVDGGSFEATDNKTDLVVGKVAHTTGLFVFNNLMLFVFLMIVNVVMMNLLIALFSLTVTKMNDEANAIWRQTYFNMLREYQGVSVLPVPLNGPTYAYWLISRPFVAICASKSDTNDAALSSKSQDKDWWLHDASSNSNGCPDDYVMFLRFQAENLRQMRPQLTREVARSGGDAEDVKVHTSNRIREAAESQEEKLALMEGRLEGVESCLERLSSDQGRSHGAICKRLQATEEQMQELAAKMDQIIDFFRQSAE